MREPAENSDLKKENDYEKNDSYGSDAFSGVSRYGLCRNRGDRDYDGCCGDDDSRRNDGGGNHGGLRKRKAPKRTTEAADAAEVMSYEEYMAAELDSNVVIEAYVQAKQSWWEDKATLYTQDQDGAYFVYNVACSEEDYEKLVPGTKIRVNGYKAEWSGEVEIMDGTFEFVEDGDTFLAEAFDATELSWNGRAHQPSEPVRDIQGPDC